MDTFVLDKKLSIEPEYGQVLMDMVIKNRPEHVVEIGTGQGYSTTWILKGLNSNNYGVVYTFDSVDRRPYAWDAEGIERHRVKILTDFNIVECPSKVDMVFHDSGHWIEHVMTDFESIKDSIPAGGFFLVHDIIYSKDMGEKLKVFFDSLPGWEYREMREGCGLGIAERVK